MASRMREIREWIEFAEDRAAAKEEAKKAASADIDPKKHGLFAGSRPKSRLVRGINRLRLVQSFSEIGKDKIVEDEQLLPRLLAENLEQNLDYYVLLPRPALVEAREHGQEVVPISPAELDEETRRLLEMTEIPAQEQGNEESKSEDEHVEGDRNDENE